MFQIDPMSRVPIYEQLVSQVKRLTLAGVLLPGEQLPSVRTLSYTLSVNPNTIQKAYNDLCMRGIACSVPGRGCFIAPDALERLKGEAYRRLPAFRALTKELMLAGLEKNDLLDIVEELYSERSNRHDTGDQSDQTV